MDAIPGKRAAKALCAVIMALAAFIFFPRPVIYAAGNPVKITVNQVLNANAAPGDTFTYKLRPLASRNPMPAESSSEGYVFTITGSSNVNIQMSEYKTQGVYKYEIFQVIGAAKTGYVYDTRIYSVEAYVGSALDIKIVAYNGDGTKTGDITFRNAYNLLPTDPGLMPDIPVRKTVFGSPSRKASFMFKLEASDPSQPMPAGSANGVKTVYVADSGGSAFGVWSYDREGTFYYTVYEENTGIKGYKYDPAIYTITDMVKEANGRLILTRVATNGSNKPVTSFIFNNYYNSGGNGGINPPHRVNPPDVTDTADGIDIPFRGDSPEAVDGIDYGTGIGDNGFPGGASGRVDGVTVLFPKTGDSSDTGFYYGLFILGGVLTAGSGIYLIAGGKRGRRRKQA